jgi:hypothetical protein
MLSIYYFLRNTEINTGGNSCEFVAERWVICRDKGEGKCGKRSSKAGNIVVCRVYYSVHSTRSGRENKFDAGIASGKNKKIVRRASSSGHPGILPSRGTRQSPASIDVLVV